jgi:hypothetical protein
MAPRTKAEYNAQYHDKQLREELIHDRGVQVPRRAKKEDLIKLAMKWDIEHVESAVAGGPGLENEDSEDNDGDECVNEDVNRDKNDNSINKNNENDKNKQSKKPENVTIATPKQKQYFAPIPDAMLKQIRSDFTMWKSHEESLFEEGVTKDDPTYKGSFWRQGWLQTEKEAMEYNPTHYLEWKEKPENSDITE